jgi:hypothetical protein
MRNWILLFLLLSAGCGDSDRTIREKADKAYANKDYVTALGLYSKLANKGDAGAQTKVGIFYSAGWGVEKNGKEAVMWWTKAAEQGEVGALNNVANAYKYGKDDNPPDYGEAIKWYEKCVAHSACFVEYGDMYETGLGVQADQVEAARLYKLGADIELTDSRINSAQVSMKADAEVHLARMYANGRGVQRDCAEATRLMTLAAGRNTISSEIAKNKLRESMFRRGFGETPCPGMGGW